MVPFGFSAGDIVAGIGLLIKAYQAVRDTGGARADYQANIDWLDTLTKTLESLREDEGDDVPSVSDALKQRLIDFKCTVEKYAASLGPNTKASTLKRVPRELQWTFASRASKEVKKLREEIQPLLHALQIELQRRTR